MPGAEINTAGNEINGLLEQIGQLKEENGCDKCCNTNVLVVDDEEIMRSLLSDVLQDEGYKVSSLASAEEALERVAKGEVEIIITDVKMKGMNGIELLKKTKEINPEIDVIVMTGYGSVKTAVESMKLGAIDYLTKPLDIEHIRVVVNKAAKHRSIRRRAKESSFYKKLSQLDGLTELFNHRFFQQLLNIEIARADRENWSLSLIMLDIDDFKAFNDCNGHPLGDLALKRVSWLIRTNARRCDFVARYGGEEFAIITPNIGKKVAEIMANRLRKVVEETRFEHEEALPKGKFTVSQGIAEYPADAGNREELIEKADQALYQAKRAGKNRVCVYNAHQG